MTSKAKRPGAARGGAAMTLPRGRARLLLRGPLALACVLLAALAPVTPARSEATPSQAPDLAPAAATVRTGLTPVAMPRATVDEARRAAFKAFVQSLWPEVSAAGVSRRIFDAATRDLEPDPSVLERLDTQPEHVRPPWAYLEGLVSAQRIAAGRAKLVEIAGILDAVETLMGVDRRIVVAIWGVESNFGAAPGDRNVIQSLATLAFEGRRQTFGRRELIHALRILERGDVDLARMTGSWAGAMGHTQFIPSTYAAYAVDFDKDGRRDIWGGIPDALASTANYLRVSGWRAGERWGVEVRLPGGFDFGLAARRETASMADWTRRGVSLVDGRPLPASGLAHYVVLPAGARGPAFLVNRNFRAILRYNNSVSYALAVGLLADAFAGVPAVQAAWPRDERPLGRSERIELQRLLARNGFEIGVVDGVLGTQSRRAVQAMQKRLGWPEDGYPSSRLLEHLRAQEKP